MATVLDTQRVPRVIEVPGSWRSYLDADPMRPGISLLLDHAMQLEIGIEKVSPPGRSWILWPGFTNRLESLKPTSGSLRKGSDPRGGHRFL